MKKTLQKMACAAVCVSILSAATFVQAQDKKSEPPKIEVAKRVDASKGETAAPVVHKGGAPYGGTLSAVDKAAMTITVKKKAAEKIFSVTSSTKFIKAAKPATLEDGVIGEEVGIYFKDVDGKAEALSVRFGAKPEVDKTGKPKQEAKADVVGDKSAASDKKAEKKSEKK